jgi:hypothetical protein
MTLEDTIVRLAAKKNPGDPARLRQEVLGRIAHARTITTLIRARQRLLLPPSVLLRLREEILTRIRSLHPSPFGAHLPFVLFHWPLRPLPKLARPLAVLAILTLVLRFMPTLFLAPPLEASTEHRLLPTSGAVFVMDGPVWEQVEGPLELQGPLTVRTGSEGSATIVLGSWAILRPGENTEVILWPAAFDPSPSSRGPIARVSYGQLWLASFLPDGGLLETSLLLPQGSIAVRQGSTSILADPQQSTVQIFRRFAKVLPIGAAEPIHLMEGDQLSLPPGGETFRQLITESTRSEEWVKENLAKDAVHRMEVAKRQQEIARAVAGILPTSAFYTLKRASEQVDLLLTFREEAWKEKKVQFAQTRLHEAVALLEQGEEGAAEQPLADYREAIRELASITEDEALLLLTPSLVTASATVAAAVPHSPLYPVKETLVTTMTELQPQELPTGQVELYLLGDALLEIEGLVAQGNIAEAAPAYRSIEGAVASVLTEQHLGEIPVDKDSLKAIKTILRSLAISLTQAEEQVSAGEALLLADLQKRLEGQFPTTPPTIAETSEPEQPCMTVREVTRTVNRFLSSIYTYQTPRAQRNEVLRQITLLPDCRQSGRVLAKVLNKVPVFTRSFVWEALQKIGAET